MTTPSSGRFVICRLGLTMFNPHNKFEAFIIFLRGTHATRCISANGEILKQSRDHNHAPYVSNSVYAILMLELI